MRCGILRYMARLNISLAAVPASCLVSACAFAEDVAGVLRVASETNGEAIVEMPFMPFGDGTISTFLSGTFFGDGGADSDRIWRISGNDGSFTNAVFASGEWIDPADRLASTLTAACGDTLVFASGDMTPFDFWLHGRVVPRAGWPFISGFSVAPDGTFADIAVAYAWYSSSGDVEYCGMDDQGNEDSSTPGELRTFRPSRINSIFFW